MVSQPTIPGIPGEMPRLDEFGRHAETTLRHREIAHAPVTVRAPVKALPGILEKGIRTQYETGTSEGVYDPQMRRSAEKNMGYSDHPVYGYLDVTMEGRRADTSTYYGPMKFTMKDSVRDRTTVYGGDSLPYAHEGDRPADYRSPPPTPLRGVQAGAEPIVRMQTSDGPPLLNERSTPYVEAHIHSESGEGRASVDIDRDVLGVQFDWASPSFGYHGTDYEPDAVDALASRVPVTHRTRAPNYQPPLPFTERETEEQGFMKRHIDEDVRWIRGRNNWENYSYRDVITPHEKITNKEAPWRAAP